jgi:TnpA family transposase
VADNYTPFYSIPIECTDRDAPYVLDGLLYNESDLSLEEHYTDTHGYTENNFAAFAMLDRRFAPRKDWRTFIQQTLLDSLRKVRFDH